MGRRRGSVEGDVVQFFTQADLEVALVLFRAVRGILEGRGAFATRTPAGRLRSRKPARREEDIPLPFEVPVAITPAP